MAEEPEDTNVDIQDFILARELAEVYLLMDHISACQNKEIPQRIANDPVFVEKGGKPWLQQICEIAWPPDQTTHCEDARNAAKLIRAKDVLNKAASPATGGSIAFTLMVAGEARDPQSGSWWRRALMWMADAEPSGLSAPDGPGGATGAAPGWPGGKPPSRASLAALAYPSLSRRAWRYRVALYTILVFLVFWLWVTCILSWDLATGNSLLGRVTALDARIVTLQSAAAAPTGGATGASAAPPAAAPAPQKPPTAVAPSTPEDLARALEMREVARGNLAAWMDRGGWIRTFLRDRIGGADEETYLAAPPAPPGAVATPGSPPRGKTNAEWAAALLGVLASNILPIFYGLLGAGAAIVRQVSAKMRDSVLTPRDILLAYVQLALGAVIGACIGLFVNSDGSSASAQSGLLASVPLSASALCFVAGFGVEGVFQALESLIRRVFNLEPARPVAGG
jgi:hypothetical protein